MTQQKKMKKAKCCGCFAWLFARWARRSPPEDLDSTVEDTKNAQDDAGERGQGSLSLVCLENAAQPLSVVEEELPSDTQDADGVVEEAGKESHGRKPETLVITIHLVKRERVDKPVDKNTVAEKDWKQKEGHGRKPETLVITIHLVKRERVDKPVDENTVAEKDWKQKEGHGRRVETLIITLHMVKREKIKEVYEELPSEHHGTAGDAPSCRSKAVTGPPEKTPLKSSFRKHDAPPNPAKKVVRFSFQNLNTFVKDRELYCGYDYFKYGFPLSMIRSELERTVKPQEEPAKEAVNKLPEKTVSEKATHSDNKTTEPQHLTGILKKGKTASTAHKCLRFNFQNLNTFVKDRELYCGYDYFKYGFPLSMIRSELQKPKERTVKSQEGPVQDAANKHNTLHQQTVRAAGCAPMNTTTEGKSPKGILKKEKMTGSTCPKHVRFNLGNLRAPVKERELYRGHDYFRYAEPLQVTQSPNVASRPHQQPVRSASNSLRGAPRHLGRPRTQRSNDSFQQNSGRNAAHNYTNNRHSQHRHHNSSSHVSPRYETRYFYEGQTNPGTNSRSRSRVKRGAKPSEGDVLGAQGEYTAS
ncbi:uncharacterized protein LOC126985006 isoform X2 [Eriocheir sinensis]|uniref:uncharacterized protein LOC126985006 isoform X2 n=1 Tax=Eriocheir sinensis TaxID=95602 RepID=UPI0021C8232D|nr:uncharacterized protein LOC126985006 isoform X2 [Eriocheir sinensis]